MEPNANIGIACGLSGIVVLDADGPQGVEALEGVLKRLGIDLSIQVRATTGGGGLHVYFRVPVGARLKSRHGLFGGKVDVKAGGAYIVAHPSIHETGNLYEWILAPDPHNIEVLPDSLYGLIKGGTLQRGNNGGREINDVGGERILEGERNNALTSEGGKLRRYGADENNIRESLLAINSERCEPPLPITEVSGVAKNVARYEPKYPGPTPGDFPDNEFGNAERLVARHGKDIRFCFPQKKWYVWTGKVWKPDTTGRVISKGKETIRSIYAEAAAAEDPRVRKGKVDWARKCETESRLNSMVNLTRCELSIEPQEFDADDWLFNCENGTLELAKGGCITFRGHRREDLITKLGQVIFDENANAPLWEAFLNDIMGGNTELIRFLQRSIGYTLTGSVREQAMFLLYGTGANGKSTFMETLRPIFGDYSRAADNDTFLRKKRYSIPNDLIWLQGARLITCAETPEGTRIDERLVKQFTGGDALAGRRLFEEYMQFYPRGKLYIISNYRPRITEAGIAIWRRIHPVHFSRTVPERDRDKDLLNKLRSESSGILNWALEGFKQWCSEGLNPPEEVRKTVEEYRMDEDLIAKFLEDCCVLREDLRTQAKYLYNEYFGWCSSKDYVPLSAKKFFVGLKERNFRTIKPKNKTVYLGIGLKSI